MYTPGVAEVCREIAKNPEQVYDYTFKGNTVAVLTDGSAVLGLGNIGAEASLPVMEGKCVLFKNMADVDAFPICLDTQDEGEIISITKKIAPVFGGVNLEDIAAPNCFIIEEKLKEILDIPVFHDDQHGTAIITCADFKKCSRYRQKKIIKKIKIVINGAGASAMACANLFKHTGIPQKI